MIKMAKMTKAMGRRMTLAIQAKMMKLLAADYVSVKDYEAVSKICRTRRNQLK